MYKEYLTHKGERQSINKTLKLRLIIYQQNLSITYLYLYLAIIYLFINSTYSANTVNMRF